MIGTILVASIYNNVGSLILLQKLLLKTSLDDLLGQRVWSLRYVCHFF